MTTHSALCWQQHPLDLPSRPDRPVIGTSIACSHHLRCQVNTFWCPWQEDLVALATEVIEHSHQKSHKVQRSHVQWLLDSPAVVSWSNVQANRHQSVHTPTAPSLVVHPHRRLLPNPLAQPWWLMVHVLPILPHDPSLALADLPTVTCLTARPAAPIPTITLPTLRFPRQQLRLGVLVRGRGFTWLGG